MRKLTIVCVLLVLMLLTAACGQAPVAETATEPASAPAAPEETTVAAEPVSTAAEAQQKTEAQTQVEASAAEAALETTETTAGSSDLIVYFSWSGNTRQVAQAIQEQTGADVFEIVPAAPYPEDYDETVDVGRQEQREGARPEFVGEIPNFDSYDRVFVGFPNWWGDMPMIVYTFFDNYDLSGKTLAPFVTSSSSGFSGTRSAMEQLEPNAQLTAGLDVKERDLDSAAQSVTDWLTEIQG